MDFTQIHAAVSSFSLHPRVSDAALKPRQDSGAPETPTRTTGRLLFQVRHHLLEVPYPVRRMFCVEIK